MLNQKEVKRIPKGTFSNSMLRAVFGDKHGSPVMERFTQNGWTFDRRVIGNRKLRRYRENNPLTPIQPPKKWRDRVAQQAKETMRSWRDRIWESFVTLWLKTVVFFRGGSSGQSPK